MNVSCLPKAELHCHLLGVITPALLSSIQAAGGHVLVEPGALATSPPIRDLAGFRRWLEILRPYQSATAEDMRPVLAAHVSNLVAQRVVYAEIMVSPLMFPLERAGLLSAFRRWRDWAYELEHGQTQLEFLMVVPRTLAAEILERDVDNFSALGRAGLIAGVALVGIETGASVRRFASAFERWRSVGLGIEIHAGEHGGVEAVHDALDFARPDRLGHGLAAFWDDDLLARLRSDAVHVEFAPTSNVRTGAIANLKIHPARRARQLGLSFSLNTDNPGAFDCSMRGEYQVAVDAWGFDRADLDAVFRHSMAARFQPVLRHLPDVENTSW